MPAGSPLTVNFTAPQKQPPWYVLALRAVAPWLLSASFMLRYVQ
jgi:hypothetical protein